MDVCIKEYEKNLNTQILREVVEWHTMGDREYHKEAETLNMETEIGALKQLVASVVCENIKQTKHNIKSVFKAIRTFDDGVLIVGNTSLTHITNDADFDWNADLDKGSAFTPTLSADSRTHYCIVVERNGNSNIEKYLLTGQRAWTKELSDRWVLHVEATPLGGCLVNSIFVTNNVYHSLIRMLDSNGNEVWTRELDPVLVRSIVYNPIQELFYLVSEEYRDFMRVQTVYTLNMNGVTSKFAEDPNFEGGNGLHFFNDKVIVWSNRHNKLGLSLYSASGQLQQSQMLEQYNSILKCIKGDDKVAICAASGDKSGVLLGLGADLSIMWTVGAGALVPQTLEGGTRRFFAVFTRDDELSNKRLQTHVEVDVLGRTLSKVDYSSNNAQLYLAFPYGVDDLFGVIAAPYLQGQYVDAPTHRAHILYDSLSDSTVLRFHVGVGLCEFPSAHFTALSVSIQQSYRI